MCLCVYDIWKTQLLLLILHKLLNKSKNSTSSLPLTLAILCQVEMSNKLFGLGTTLCCVFPEPLPLHLYLVYPSKSAGQIHANS